MKIYEVEYLDSLTIIIAESEVEARKFVLDDIGREEDEPIEMTIREKRGLHKGIVFSFDYEDFYWRDEL